MIANLQPKELGARIASVAEEFPVGSTVWHRGNGQRGIVVEYVIDGQGCVMIVVDWAANCNWDKCCAVALSSTKVTDDNNGDGWLKAEES
jgi:hypothetical protein